MEKKVVITVSFFIEVGENITKDDLESITVIGAESCVFNIPGKETRIESTSHQTETAEFLPED